LKPVKQSEVFEAVVEALQIEPSSEDTAEPTDADRSTPNRQLNLLLAEDNKVNQRLARGILEKIGHNVTIVENGQLALEAIQQHAFDLVLMDVQMPVMDGLEATAAIRGLNDRKVAAIPIVAMTAHAMQGDREKCIDSGMDDYVSKPIRSQILAEILDRLARTRDLGSMSESQKNESASECSDQPVLTSATGDQRLVDWDAALAGVDGDADLLRDVVEAFVEEADEMIGLILQSVASRDHKVLHRAAHTLKGTLMSVGAPGPSQTAGEIEQLAANEFPQESASLVSQLQQQHRSVVAELRVFLDGDG